MCTLLLALLAVPQALDALEPTKLPSQYDITTWDSEEGLPQNAVTALLPSRAGYLWIGTQQGLARFDGQRFESFLHRNTAGLGNDLISSLAEDWQGGVWVGTNSGLSRFAGGSFRAYTGADGLGNEVIQCLLVDHHGELWAGTRSGLFLLRSGRFERHLSSAGNDGPETFINFLLEDRTGNLWVATRGGLLRAVDGEVAERFGPEQGLPDADVRSLAEDASGGLWVGTTGGLVYLRAGDRSPQRPPELPANTTIYSLLVDRLETLWIATQKGLVRHTPRSTVTLTPAHGLPSDFIVTLAEDHLGSLWVGTFQGGLSRLRDHLFTAWTQREGLSSNLVSSITEDRDGALWIGTQDGLNRLEDGRITVFRQADGLVHDGVVSLLADQDGSLWVGTRGGLSHLRQGTFRNFTHADGLVHDFVMSLLRDRSGALWVGTRGGLSRFQDGRWSQLTTADGLASDWIHYLFEDASGDLWLGTGEGLNRLHQGRVEPFAGDAELGNSLILHVRADPEDGLWLSSYGNGLIWLQQDGTIHRLTVADGLPDDLTLQILDDEHGFLWLSSNRGVAALRGRDLRELALGHRDSLPVISYGRADGLPSSSCTGAQQPAGTRARDGRLWFPTPAGAAVIDPARVESPHPPPPVQVEQLATRSRTLIAPSRAELAPSEQDFEVSYGAVDLRDAERLRFRYRLTPYQEAWVEAAGRRVAFFTNIPPGRYRFQVQAAHPEGPWSTDSPDLPLTVHARFVRTPWFALLVAAGLTLAIWGGYRLRVRSLMGRAAELEVRVTERTSELVRQRDRLTLAHRKLRALDHEKDEIIKLTAHDLRAPLVTLQGFIGELRTALEGLTPILEKATPQLPDDRRQEVQRALKADLPEALGFISSSVERVSFLVDGMAQFARLSRRALHIEEVDMEQLAEEVLVNLHPEITEHQATVRLGPLPTLPTDRVFLHIILEDLLRYALSALPADSPGRVELLATPLGRETLFQTWHNGRGIARDQESKVFRLFNQPPAGHPAGGSSFGLAYVHALVHRLGGRIWFESEAQTGTRFCFTLPHQPPEDPTQRV